MGYKHQQQDKGAATWRTAVKNHTLQSLQQLLINTQLGDDPAFRDNFRSLAATVFHLEDCLMEPDDEEEKEA